MIPNYISDYLGIGEEASSKVYKIGYRGGTLVTQLWFIHNKVITGFQWIMHCWLLGYVIVKLLDKFCAVHLGAPYVHEHPSSKREGMLHLKSRCKVL